MKKIILCLFLFIFTMLVLMPGDKPSAAVTGEATFGFDIEETEYDNTVTETITIGGTPYTLSITSNNSADYVADCLIGVDGWLASNANSGIISGYGVQVSNLDEATLSSCKPHGTVTVSCNYPFTLKSFVCASEQDSADTLTISDGAESKQIAVPGRNNVLIEPDASTFQRITEFTVSWVNDYSMTFDNFVVDFGAAFTSQPGNASVSGGGNTSFSVGAIGNALTYQWQVDTGSGFADISDAGVYSNTTTATLSITGANTGMNNYKYQCKVTSDGFVSFSNAATLTVLAEAPTNIALDNTSVAENTASGEPVGTFTSTDADTLNQNSFTYSLADTATNPDNNSFAVSGRNLLLNMVPNHETKSSYTICVQTQDDTGLTFKKTLSIEITDVNEKPATLTLSSNSVAENSTPGDPIGNLTGTDPDDGDNATLSYSLPVAADRANFLLSGSTLQIGMSPNYEGTKIYNVTVRVTDHEGSFYEVTFTINITNVNEPAIDITLSGTNVLEHSPVGTEVGALTCEDLDGSGTFTYELATDAIDAVDVTDTDTDNSCFTIVGDKLKLNIEPDYETKLPDHKYKIRIKVTDQGGLSYEEAMLITVLDGNDPPTNITLTGGSIAENSAPNSSVGTLASTDNPGDTFTYSLAVGAGDTDNAIFSISGSALIIKVSADYETKNTYSIRIRSMDDHGLYYEKALTINITNVNEAPTDMALTNDTIAENSAIGTTIGTLSGTDQDAGTTLAFSLVPASLDNSSFTISEGSLKLAVKPDFETKDTYSVLVRESDGSLTFDKVFTIHITDAGDAPTDISISATAVLEHCAVDTTIGSFSSTDLDADQLPDDFDYTLVTGIGDTDNASFSILLDTLKIKISPDFEVKPSYSIRVRTTDADGLFYEEAFTITITDGGDPPTDISLSNQSIAENSPGLTVIGTFSSTDINAGTFTYTFASGTGDTDNASFTIEDNALELVAAPNYEIKSSYSIRIRTTNDSTHFYFDKAFTITITNVNEAPTGINLSSTNITEHVASGTMIATLSGIDPDAGSTFTYALAAGTGDADNASFTISGNELKLAVVPDYEVRPTYNIRIKVTDNGSLTYEKDFILTVINGNDPPTDIIMSSSSIQENIPAGNLIVSFDCYDNNKPTDTFHFSLVGGIGSTDNDKFEFSSEVGVENSLSMKVVPDYETKDSYNIRVRVTDSGGLYYEKAFTITIENMPEAPTNIQLSPTRVAENRPVGTDVGTLTGTDQDALSTFTYSLVTGAGDTDNASFAIAVNKLQTASSFDYEAKSSYSIRIRVTDNTGLWYEKQFTISVDDGNDAPSDISLFGTSIEENSAVGTSVGTLSGIDQDAGSTFTYAFAAGVGDTDNSCFTLSGNVLKLAVVPDFETKAIYDIRIKVTDNSLLTFERRFVISIIDGNDAPTDIILSDDNVDENTASDTTVATMSSTDLNGGTFTYTLATGAGSTDNSIFTITGSSLKISIEPDHESKSEYHIRIRTTDNGGMSFEKAFVISVNDINEAPTGLSLSSSSINENNAAGTSIGTLTGIDADAGSTFTYSLVSGAGDTDNAAFTIAGNALKAALAFDYETKQSYSIRLRVTDAGGLYFEKQITISVNDINENPPVQPITDPNPEPVVEKITVDVTNGSTDDSVAEIEVERTTTADGIVTDSITVDETKAAETIEKLQEEDADAARIVAPVTEEEVSEITMTIPGGSLELLSDSDLNLELETEDAVISIPNTSLDTANEEMEEDLYFKVTPVTDEKEQQELSERAADNGMLVQMMGDNLSLIGRPMEIETNMPQTEVDIILPLTGLTIPEDEEAREALINSLAVYVEHSDGEKEVIKGELVEYKEGCFGIKIKVSKFSSFTIFKDNKSDKCEILSVKSPAGTEIRGYYLRYTFDYKVSSVKINIKVSEGATWKLYSDRACTHEISKKVKLKVGLNRFYIKVLAEDGIHNQVYTVYFTRSKKLVVN